MIPIVCFIGWHDAGKTTLVSKVVEHLRQLGLRVAVIKSSSHAGIPFDEPGTDTDSYRRAGAEPVMLLAPDQMVIMSGNPGRKLVDIAGRSIHDVDIIIGEGFKNERHVKKIEVTRQGDNLLRDTVNGVIAMVTDQPLSGENVFRFEQTREIAEFIRRSVIDNNLDGDRAVLYVNGRKIPMKGFVQEALAGTVNGFVKTLKKTGEIRNIELRILLK